MWDGKHDSLFSRLADTLRKGEVTQGLHDEVEAEIEAALADAANNEEEEELDLQDSEDGEIDDESEVEMDSQDFDDIFIDGLLADDIDWNA